MLKSAVFSTPEAFNSQFFKPAVVSIFFKRHVSTRSFLTSEAAAHSRNFCNTMFNSAVFFNTRCCFMFHHVLPLPFQKLQFFFRCMFFSVAFWKHQGKSFTLYFKTFVYMFCNGFFERCMGCSKVATVINGFTYD